MLLLVAAQTIEDRPELLIAAQLTVIAGLVHNLAIVQSEPTFVVVLFVAATCSAAAVHLPGGRSQPGL
ncbi:hypothetical protein [Nonomuraea gerenzanensis]|uniref:Uncharacterized protein n=1 Tax=Nonomuraea gerenzanensis TaxID=93944 RepID=A0A1M4ECE9_9ACTN|nr:hypothetical protein [Nonomuraea gerenzanensis]UBU18498.1 hypothetical protein LCN96_26805 [Nonomuraea gerenzanensis]SBO96338.1 hypothetical protein BN4615_P5854 [Nonomuraea gerenzanensis]